MSIAPLLGILPLDKPPDWTSHDVVAKARGILGLRRVGHAGTLDPMATGLLVVLVGKATRLMDLLPGDKTYETRLRLGFRSDTLDAEGEVRPTGAALPALQEIYAVLPRFLGSIEQIPPMVSAVKVNGQRLYKLARQGLEIERKPRPVTVYALDIQDIGLESELGLTVTCSSGTYVRTLIDDLGDALGCGAIMTALRRVRSGPYDISQATSLEELSRRKGEDPSGWLLPIQSALPDIPSYTPTAAEERALYQGKPVAIRDGPLCEDGQLCWLTDEAGAAFALARAEQGAMKLHVNFKD